jgi:hypothetical protein
MIPHENITFPCVHIWEHDIIYEEHDVILDGNVIIIHNEHGNNIGNMLPID